MLYLKPVSPASRVCDDPALLEHVNSSVQLFLGWRAHEKQTSHRSPQKSQLFHITPFRLGEVLDAKCEWIARFE